MRISIGTQKEINNDTPKYQHRGVGCFAGMLLAGAPGKFVPYPVTALHNIAEAMKGCSDPVYIIAFGKDGLPKDELLPLDYTNYTHHKDILSNDIAIYNMMPDSCVIRYEPIMPSDMVTSWQLKTGAVKHNYKIFAVCVNPTGDRTIIKTGNINQLHIQSVYVPTIGIIGAYVSKLEVREGNSGSPVFLYVPLSSERARIEAQRRQLTSARFLGIVHGHLPNGSAVIIPADKLIEMLYQDTLENERKEILEKEGWLEKQQG